ncbi:MAG: hypothetical protein C5B48_03820 [Candidatus Rokuibacteriota bacterium]|nr:MAG: hypothetical protein C5B48_03820 [Candidatus Rokubacteria bacterium]
MCLAGLLSGVCALLMISGEIGSADLVRCLPEGVNPTDVVSVRAGKPELRSGELPAVTVEDTLKAIGARCRRGKLVDPKGTEITFFRLSGCWGNPPADYRDILEQQTRDLARLRQKYRVVEMTCNPTGEPIL